MSHLNRLRERLAARKHGLKRQSRLYRKDHRRGHARRAKRDAAAIRHLKWLISREERRRRRRAPKVMFDDTSVGLIPDKAPAVLGYVEGLYTTWPEIVSGFPHAEKLSCAVFTPGKGRCLDIENGDATPAAAPTHVRARQASHPRELPVLYCSISVAPEVVARCKARGIHRREYFLLTAHYTYEPHICGPRSCGYPTKADGTQWTDRALGRSLDESRLSSDFFASH